MKYLLLIGILLLSITHLIAQPEAGRYGTYLSRDNAGNYTGFVVLPTDQEEGFCFMVTFNTYDGNGNILYSEIGYGRCAPENGRFTVNFESETPNMWLEFGNNEAGKTILTVIVTGKSNRIYYFTQHPFSDKKTVDFPDLCVFEREDGSIISIWNDEGIRMFRAEGLPEENCETICVDGILDRLDVSEETYFYSINGCKTLLFVLTDNILTVTEKTCRGLDRKSCTQFTGIYHQH